MRLILETLKNWTITTKGIRGKFLRTLPAGKHISTIVDSELIHNTDGSISMRITLHIDAVDLES